MRSNSTLRVVLLLFILSLILFIDRASVSTVKGQLASELLLTDQQVGWVFSIFSLGYALGQIPGGWFADRFGPRMALAAVVIAWSIFTGLTGMMHALWLLLIVRFLFGLFEGGCFPGCARVFYNWLHVSRRGLANGVVFSGSRVGAALAFLLLPLVFSRFYWRPVFWALATMGIAWAVVWLLWFRDYPSQPVDRSTEQSATHKRLTFREVVGTRSLVLVTVQYFINNFTYYLGLSWMLPLLEARYSLAPEQAGFFSMVPFIFAATSLWVTGFLVDRIYNSELCQWSRRLPAMLGFVLAAGGMVGMTWAPTATWAVVFLTMAIYGIEMTVPPSWTHCVDIAGTSAGAISGTMNGVGNLGSFLCAAAFPWLTQHYGRDAYFWLAAMLNLLGLVIWFWIVPEGGVKRKAISPRPE